MTDLFEQSEAPPPVDEWAEARKAAALNAIVFKHIDRINGKECFVEIPRTETNVSKGLDLYDGAIVTYRASDSSHLPLQGEGRDGDGSLTVADHAGAPA